MKQIYLLVFKIKYLLSRTKQNEKTVLFITNFDSHHTIDRNISHFHYTKLYIDPKYDGMKKQIRAIKNAKYIFVDNYYVGFAAINTSSKVITQIWHANGAVKKFSLADLNNIIKDKDVKRYKKVYESFDHIVCSNDIMGNNFIEAFGLEDDSKLLKLGYPKMDLLYSNKFDDESEKVMLSYPNSMNKISILYLPTFRDSDADNNEQLEFLKYLNEHMGPDYHLFYHLHPKLKNEVVNGENITEILNEDVMYFYKISNLIITDYSSIIFEATKFNTPIIHYLYDYDTYSKKPGLFMEKDQMPGLVCFDKEDVLSNIYISKSKVDYSNFYNVHNQYARGTSGRDIVLNILGGNK